MMKQHLYKSHTRTHCLLLAVLLYTLSAAAQPGAPLVLLDQFFNREYRTLANGQRQPYHYTWTDTAQTGYSHWGQAFVQAGARIASLDTAPTKSRLSAAAIYIIADADTPAETDKPEYVLSSRRRAILQWVRQGGVLVVMSNDSVNAEQHYINRLLRPAGIRLRADRRSEVHNDQFDMGAFIISDGHPIFTTARKLYLKEVSSLELERGASCLISHQQQGYCVAAMAPLGKGTVVVVGDPWLYNEYVNGKLTDDFQNRQAMHEFSRWLLQQARR